MPAICRNCLNSTRVGVVTPVNSDRRDELLGEFPLALAAGKVTNTWRSTAEGLYRNWLHYIQNEKERAEREMTHAAAG